ncbi:hypothetical protein V5799_006424 [Amblyomma americanum]|uniref:Carboxylesterase type B domain-containing protein n=1 Tax=Amblyomma americanum TaxID=6943 RepID=A0AAQ4DWF6_AMBAM
MERMTRKRALKKKRKSSTQPPRSSGLASPIAAKMKAAGGALSPFRVFSPVLPTGSADPSLLATGSGRGSPSRQPPPKKDAFEEWYEAAHKMSTPRMQDSGPVHRKRESIGYLRGFLLGVGAFFSIVLFASLIAIAYWYPLKRDRDRDDVTLTAACATVRLQQLEVVTTSGVAIGKPATTGNASGNGTQGVMRHFFGIPYAHSPTGARRFAVPVAVRNFEPNGSWQAMAHGPPCPQVGPLLESSKEDCLTISVWAPYICNDSEPLKTVVVAVTGDWLQNEDVRQYEDVWQELVLRGDLIVAVPNYRPGVLGFYAGVDDSSAPGNVGMYDVYLAVAWIHNNAAAFHGDANSMVALGHNSGSFMLSSILFTNHSRYFKRYLLHGLSVTTVLPRNEESGASLLSNAMHCPNTVPNELTRCLRLRNFTEIVDKSQTFLPLRFVPSRYRKPLSAELYTDDMPVMLRNLTNVDILCGSSIIEGNELFDKYVIPGMKLNDNMSTAQAFTLTGKFFTDTVTLDFETLSEVTKAFLRQPQFNGLRSMLTDIVTTCPMHSLAKAAVRKGARVYRYASAGALKFLEPVLTVDDIAQFSRKG